MNKVNSKSNMKYRLQDLIDIEHFQNLQDRLNEIYSFPSSIIDNDGNILTATAWQDICTHFHRKNKDTELLCIKSDQYIQSHIHEANPAVSYRCPHGLVDNATPIIIDGIHYGNFFTGQFFLEEPDLNFFKVQARKYGFDEEAYLEAVKKVPIWTQSQMENYLFFIKGLIAVISESGLKKLQEMEARKQIEESEERFRRIYEYMPIGVARVSLDFRIESANDAYCRMLGYHEDELIGKHLQDITHPEVIEKNLTMQKQLAAGKIDHYGMEKQFIHKDGHTVYGLLNSSLIQGDDGKPLYFIGSVADITERKQAEKEREKLQAQLSNALEVAHLGHWEYDVVNDIFTFNDHFYKIFHITASHVGGYTMSSAEYARRFVHPDDIAVVGEETRKAIETHDPFFSRQLEHRIIYADGTVGYMAVRFFIQKGTYGKTVRTYGVNQDITDQKKLQTQLQQAQKMEAVGSLAGGIAHDLNNILYPISGLSEMLLDEIPPENPAHESIEQIHKSAQRGSDLVKQILAFSRQSNPQKLPIQIQPILKEVLKLSRATIPTNIQITIQINTDCGRVSADPTQIHQIAMNLITNAYHAVEGSGGTINIALKETAIGSFGEKDGLSFHAIPGNLLAGRYACITVSDTGTGIDQTLIDKIFEPYFTTKELGKGTGLGLSVVHGIVKQHGGDIRVYSEVGKGTTFNVYLPLLEDARGSKTSTVVRKLPMGTEKILLIDDEAPILRMEQMMLERLGYQVTSRISSPDALAVFKADPEHFDLVISDRGMPNMTGEQLAVELISIRPGIPVILCTGFSNEADVQRAMAMGIKGFLMKPVAIGDLAAMVRKVIDDATGSSALSPIRPAVDRNLEDD